MNNTVNMTMHSRVTMESDYSKLKRPKHPMPNYIQEALEKHNLLQDYKERPAYQKNDYIGWIEQAKRQETRDKRLQQMLTELEEGGIYMKMRHPASAKNF